MPAITGNLQGLKPSQLDALERLYKRRFPREQVFSHDQARELALLSRGIGRQIGLLIDRRGKVFLVIAGDAARVMIPELPKGGADLRLLHTHLNEDGLSREDLLDMLFLKLDAVVALTVGDSGEPGQWQYGVLQPEGKDPYAVSPLRSWHENSWDFHENFQERKNRTTPRESPDRAVLISVSTEPIHIQEGNLDELALLAKTAGLTVGDRLIQRVPAINPQFILGKGKLAELEIMALNANADLLVFDGEISPGQLNNIAETTRRKVIDRTQLILDIFARHAVTGAGKLQVELAQLAYAQPRLTGKHNALDRLMGGIGGRGPGESRLEMDRRKSRERMAHLRRELEKLRARRGRMRQNRERRGNPIISLVGYTNAGKSTLLNRLTNSSIITADRLFATLDPTARRLALPGNKKAIILDTVGFIRNLPRELMDAFSATLEELDKSDLLLHVVDASAADVWRQLDSVNEILRNLGLDEKKSLLVFNKCDCIDEGRKQDLKEAYPNAQFVSAHDGRGIAAMLEQISTEIPGGVCYENYSGDYQ